MYTLFAVNVNDAYRAGLRLLHVHGVVQPSRVGPVRVVDAPVTTRYSHPLQRVLFDAQRDANPFFHLFEALWMLAGRNDLRYLTQFLPSFAAFSDDGVTLHGAYGYRWRHLGAWGPDSGGGLDQIQSLVQLLKNNPMDRRAVLQMWDAHHDLNPPAHRGKDIPCNDLAKFRIVDGQLDMYVFCRSNDAIYGCYGANAVHFAFLQEYMAARVGVPVGAYEQISCDFHAYTEQPYRWDKYWPLHDESSRALYRETRWVNPYLVNPLKIYPLVHDAGAFDFELEMVTHAIASEKFAGSDLTQFTNPFFLRVAQPLYQAFRLYKGGDPMLAAEYLLAVTTEHHRGENVDWIVAAREWLLRRQARTPKELSFPDKPVVPTRDATFAP